MVGEAKLPAATMVREMPVAAASTGRIGWDCCILFVLQDNAELQHSVVLHCCCGNGHSSIVMVDNTVVAETNCGDIVVYVVTDGMLPIAPSISDDGWGN